jgi:cell division septal protein FtsQ
MSIWFDDEDLSGRRRFGRRRNRRRTPVLQVRARVSTARTVNRHRVGALVLIPTAAILLCVLIFLGVRATGRALFSHNPVFTVTQVEVRAGSDEVCRLIREYTRIAEGRNIFDFNIARIREAVLEQTPGFKALSISRHLPSTVRIEVVERVPLARLGTGHLVADREGCVFVAGSKAEGLPVLVGYPDSDILPGDRIEGMATAALQVLDLCQDPRLDIGVHTVRVDDEEHLLLQATFEGRKQETPLSWDGMGQDTAESRTLLIQKVINLKRTFESAEGKGLSWYDYTYPDRLYALEHRPTN